MKSFNKSFRKFNQFSPRDSYPHNKYYLFADYVELVALLNTPSQISYADIYDRFFGEIDDSHEDYEDGKGSRNAERHDKSEKWLKRIFDVISDRSTMYGSFYPFKIKDESLKFKSKLTFKNKLYAYLLVSSNLNIFSEAQNILTTDFESISYHVLKKIFPYGEVKEFGENSIYEGNTINKIKALFNDIGLEYEEYELAQISPRNNKERGLDIAVWFPFKDQCLNRLVFLCQCTCGKDIGKKHHDVRRFSNYIKNYKLSPNLVMLTPHSLINYKKNKFYDSDEIESGYLHIERKRITDLFNNRKAFELLKSLDVVNACIEYEEDIV